MPLSIANPPVRHGIHLVPRLLVMSLVALTYLLSIGLAFAASYFNGGTNYSQSEIAQFFANSSNPYIASNASTFASMSMVETAGTGSTSIYNGSCCTGLMQMNNANIRQFAGMEKQDYARLGGQQQIDVYTKYYDSISKDPNIKQVQNLAQNGGYIGSHKVDANTVAACIQFGTGNCKAAIANGCSSRANGQGGDGHLSICEMAEKSRGGKQVANPGRNCTPTGSTSTNGSTGGATTTPTSAGGGTGSGTSGGTTSSSESSGASKAVACQDEDNTPLDKTSKTCTPTVPMLQNIPCEKYPAALQGFCQRYKPLQMNMSDCQKAEKYAENAAKGNRENECSQQTFRRGTSAWSFVLACSYTKTDQGTTGNADDAKKNPSKYSNVGKGGSGGGGGGGGGTSTGAADDPKCIDRLKAKVPDIKVLGQMSFGSFHGMSCTVPSAVRYRGKAIDFGQELTMDCSLAEQMENFGEAAKGAGLTRIKSLGTISCRGQTTSGSKLSSHAVGKAHDIGVFYAGGTYDTSQFFSNPDVKSFIQGKIIPIACAKFRGVLGPVFYINKGGYKHLHVESLTKGTTECSAVGINPSTNGSP